MENNQNLPEEQVQELEVVQINSTEALAALNKAEVDVQIATAKAYPRNLSNVLRDIDIDVWNESVRRIRNIPFRFGQRLIGIDSLD